MLKKLVGVHIERKKKTKYLNIETMEPVEYIKIPLYRDLKEMVKIGEYVKKGQEIAKGEQTPSLHSSISGTVENILDGNVERDNYTKLIVIKNDFEENTLEAHSYEAEDDIMKFFDTDKFFEYIKEKGIIGMGGGAYPTYMKLKSAYEKKVHTLVVNGCECEPYLNCDNRLMQEKTKEIVEGINILTTILDIKNIVIALEDDKKEAFLEFKKIIKNYPHVSVKLLKKIYPLGEERILIKEIFRMEIAKDELPLNRGYLVQNVATIYAIYEALFNGKGTIERVITIAGEGVEENKNLKVKIGTPLKDIMNYLGINDRLKKIVIGGPMTGKTVYDYNNVYVQKNYGGFLFLSKEETNDRKTEACIYCGTCVDKCPMGLLPLRFEELTNAKEVEELKLIRVEDCIECGVCTYVCPSNRPLLETIVIGKKLVREVGKSDK